MIFLLWGCTTDNTDFDSALAQEAVIQQTCFSDELHNRVGIENCGDFLCRIEEGDFQMGSDLSDDSCPVRTVWLDSFRMDKNEVTIGTWEACVQAGFCEPLPEYCIHPLYDILEYKTHPVRCVTWDKAQDFCHQYGGRLPTEAEWEKAARGREGSLYPWGNTAPDCSHSNFRLASIYCFHGETAPVGTYENYASVYGINDLAGNVFEWVADYYDAAYYSQNDNINPLGPTELCKTALDSDWELCLRKVLRGGAYNTTEHVIRGYSRSFALPDTVEVNIGFRCVYD